MIAIVTASVLGAAVIGGASAAILMSRDGDPIDGVGSDSYLPSVSDTADITGDTASDTDAATDPIGTETDLPQDSETEPHETEPITEAVTEPPQTEPVTEPPQTEPIPAETEPAGTPTVNVGDVSTLKNYRGGYLDLADYPTKGELKTAAAALKAEGYTAVMVELKYDNGKLAYKSNVADAKEWGANPSVAALDLKTIVDTLHGEGLYVSGRVCALRDDLAAKGNSDAALMNTAGFRYSDGASRWISVYSTAGQDYILALLREMKTAGVDEIMLRDFALPADAATTAPKYDSTVSKAEAVGVFLDRVDSALSGVSLNLELDAVTIAEGSDSTRGIELAKINAVSDSITADITLSNLRDGMTIGGKTIADVDADPAKTVDTILTVIEGSANSIRPLLELTGNAAKDAAQVAAVKNRGYDAYQMTERVISMTEK